MRLRNIKGAEDIIKKSQYFVENPKEYKGKLNKLFDNTNEIYIEIGMGKGDFIIENAKKYPNINFIGIEKSATILVYATRKLENIELKNLKIMNIDANSIDEYFKKEISKIYLNFSDPWPKKKHTDRRLTSQLFLDRYSKIFKKDYIIEMKTDNKKLFEFSLISLSQKDYIFNDITLNLYDELDDENIPTEYEKKFVSLNLPIYRFKAVKKMTKNVK